MQPHRVLYVASIAAVVAGAAAIRFSQLQLRPMHADESVNVARFGSLWLSGDYQYDPHEFHGPTLPYSTLASTWVSGARSIRATDEATYRIVPAVYGCGLVWLAWLLSDGLGKWPTLCGGVLVAVSPGLVYYSRYYIHESLFVFFTLAAIASAWRYHRSRGKVIWCLVFGVSIGCLQATKETSAVVYLAFLTTSVGCWTFARFRASPSAATYHVPAWHVVAAVATAGTVAGLLLSSFLTNPQGAVDGVRTYVPWLGRALGNTVHEHPWYFYLHRLAGWKLAEGPRWSEGAILLLGTVGWASAVFCPQRLPHDSSRGLICWLGGFVVTLIVVYSAIPYKTPWCALGFLHVTAVLAGIGAVVLLRITGCRPLRADATITSHSGWHALRNEGRVAGKTRPSLRLRDVPPRTRKWKVILASALRGVVGLVLVAATCHLGWQSYRASYVLAADPRNPYVYAHTSDTIGRLVDDLHQLADAAPAGLGVHVKLIWEDNYYWPLPWYLRRFSHVEYYNRVPANASAPLVLATAGYDAALTRQLDQSHLMTGYYAIRPHVLAQLWVRRDLWEMHLSELGRISTTGREVSVHYANGICKTI